MIETSKWPSGCLWVIILYIFVLVQAIGEHFYLIKIVILMNTALQTIIKFICPKLYRFLSVKHFELIM